MISKSAGVRNVFSSAHIERGRGSSSAELIQCCFATIYIHSLTLWKTLSFALHRQQEFYRSM